LGHYLFQFTHLLSTDLSPSHTASPSPIAADPCGVRWCMFSYVVWNDVSFHLTLALTAVGP
jgi:hypothetical protein